MRVQGVAERHDFALDQKLGRCHGSPNMPGTSFIGEKCEVGASYKGVHYLRLESTIKEVVVVHQTYNKLLIASCYQTYNKYNNV